MNSQSIVVLTVFLQIFKFIESSDGIQLSLHEIKGCENYTPEADGLSVKYDLIKTDSEVSLSGSMDLGFIVDEKIEYGFNVSVLENENSWNTIFNVKGYACDVFPLIPKLWSKVAEAAKVAPKCPIEPGRYELNKFTLDSEDVDVPIVLEGKFMLQLQMYKDDKSVMCQKLLVEGMKS